MTDANGPEGRDRFPSWHDDPARGLGAVALKRNDIVTHDAVTLLRNDRGLVPLPEPLGALIGEQFQATQHRTSRPAVTAELEPDHIPLV